jgi:hypothetical protein
MPRRWLWCYILTAGAENGWHWKLIQDSRLTNSPRRNFEHSLKKITFCWWIANWRWVKKRVYSAKQQTHLLFHKHFRQHKYLCGGICHSPEAVKSMRFVVLNALRNESISYSVPAPLVSVPRLSNNVIKAVGSARCCSSVTEIIKTELYSETDTEFSSNLVSKTSALNVFKWDPKIRVIEPFRSVKTGSNEIVSYR